MTDTNPPPTGNAFQRWLARRARAARKFFGATDQFILGQNTPPTPAPQVAPPHAALTAGNKSTAQITADQPQTTTLSPIIRLTPNTEIIAPDSDRDKPYVLRGRGAEFNRVANLLVKPKHSIHLITGAPGIGKSTLLNAVETFAVATQFLVVQIDPKWFANPTTLVENIRAQTIGGELAGTAEEHAAGVHNTRNITARAGIPEHADLEYQKERSLYQSNTRTRVAPPDLQEHLALIINLLAQHEPYIRGILITSDEFQDIEGYVPQNQKELTEKIQASADYDHPFLHLRSHLRTLNEYVQKTTPPLPVVTVLSGIPPATEVLGKCLTRESAENVLELLPVDGYPVLDPQSMHCTQIIRDHLEANQTTLNHALTVPDDQLHLWGLTCQGHVLHANHAGMILQKNLAKLHRANVTTLSSQHIDDIDIAIFSARKRYYDNRLTKTAQGLPLPPKHVRNIIEHLLIEIQDRKRQNINEEPQFITCDAAEAIITSLAGAEHSAEIMDRFHRRGIIRILQPMGQFLRYDEKANFSRTIYSSQEIYVDSALPSLRHHLQTKILPEQQTAIRQHNHETLQNAPGPHTTQFTWNNAPSMEPVVDTPEKFTYEQPVEPEVRTLGTAQNIAQEIIQSYRQKRPSTTPREHASADRTKSTHNLLARMGLATEPIDAIPHVVRQQIDPQHQTNHTIPDRAEPGKHPNSDHDPETSGS